MTDAALVHERARLVGGNLEVWSDSRAGAQVELTIPAAIANLESPGGLRSQFVRSLARGEL
jgi:hypothetical protein